MIMEHFRGKPENLWLERIMQGEFFSLLETPREELTEVYRDGLRRWAERRLQQEMEALLQCARNRPLHREEEERMQWLISQRPSSRGLD
jgi:hypothetical protein